MALKQDFWSTLDQITYFEPGRILFNAIRHNATPIPVATGATKASLADLRFEIDRLIFVYICIYLSLPNARCLDEVQGERVG